ncbi:MAG: site-specific DNA-methyltransferase [Campylobacter sp.]|uniref:site-specific DNA-methyltransferase n=1 Tax=Campylobacter sp. TaxID=205 RepID=UPI002AA8695C|nr:DNA methyltransferase [Campylobacter sp.]MCI6344269.1 site-specific DNA-methyltransferase [Campylobacter sp.]
MDHYITHRQKFFSKLESIYLGTKISTQNKNGFLNILDIKEKYFKNFKQDIMNKLKESGLDSDDLGDIYNKLFTFFDSYLNESGTPYFADTPYFKNIHAKVYSNQKDTALFYKTSDLYYIKSDSIYEDAILTNEFETFSLSFNTSNFIPKSDNQKNKTYFYLKNIDNSTQQLNIEVSNQNEMEEFEIPVFKKSSSEFSDEFSKKLKEFKLNEDEVKKLFRAYKRQNEIDFFIHKNAKSFLEEQFDLFFYNYLFKDSKIQNWQDSAINKLLALRNIALFIIEKIADFENELKAIWLKPKFAKQTNFVFTLNMIKNPSEFINDKQIKEWQDLGLVTGDDYSKNPFLPLDTKFLDEKSKIKLLSQFDNIDEALNGELIKADNFQALNTIMPKYKGKIDLIYIDPPFNTGSDFAYVDRFQDSTWLTLMNNRLEIAKNLLSDKGSFYLHLDHNADYYGRILLNDTFGKENFQREIIWELKGVSGYKSLINGFVRGHETILYATKTENSIFNKQYLEYDEKQLKRFSSIDENGRKYKTITKERKLYLDESKGLSVSDVWSDIASFQTIVNSTERINSDENLTQKPEALLARIIKASSDENSRILDYHLGSGTTCATALKLGRKFIGVEMGEHFYSVIIPRIKKCLAGIQSGISKECEYKGGGAFKYYELENYEEALNNCEYEVNSSKILDYRKSKKLIKELNKEKSIDLEMSGYRKDFDIFTSYSNISGLKIKRIFSKNNQNFCEYENGEVLNDKQISLSKHEKLINLIWWE